MFQNKMKMLPASMAMRGERLVFTKAKQQVEEVKLNWKKIWDSSDCHPVQMSMPIIGWILISSQSYLQPTTTFWCSLMSISQPSKMEVSVIFKTMAICYLWLFKTNPGEIWFWIFVICIQGIIQSEDQTLWRLLQSIQIHLMKLSKNPMTPIQNYLRFLNNSEKKAQCHRLQRWVQVYGELK